MTGKEFKPYISEDREEPELTVTSIVLGILLAVIFGAANAYLGLRVGMTVSASIPAAVISMGVIRFILRKNSILENNLVQTTGSAGESVAAGAIFTLPALFLWANEGIIDKPSIITMALIALIGGILGVLFMIPLRDALIVKEHDTLPYPEGKACAEVLLAGESKDASAKTVFWGMGISAIFKFIVDGLKVIPTTLTTGSLKRYPTEASLQTYPAVLSVGYICGPKISSYLFTGGALSWLVLIPLIVTFGGSTIIFPGTETITEIYAASGASGIWSNYIRYIGAGALACGGFLSLAKSLPLIIKTFKENIKSMKSKEKIAVTRTSKNLNTKVILALVLAIVIIMCAAPSLNISVFTAVLILLFSFFFATVASRIVGVVGSSNSPVSGMSIATLIIATLILKVAGHTGAAGMVTAITIGSIVCIVAAIAGDTSQDLKTGYILGATPKKQQIGELIGVVASSIAIGGVLYLLNSAWEFGSEELAAPQATLMKMLVEGIMGGELPWTLVFIGAFIAIIVEIIGIPVLPFAIGMYLPISTTSCIMVGGLVRLVVDKLKYKDEAEKNAVTSTGTLYASGAIAGEGIVGIIFAVLAVLGVDSYLDLSSKIAYSSITSNIVAALGLLVLLAFMFKFMLKNKSKN